MTASCFQDPDQTPFTADDGGGLVKIPFTLSDVAVARWTLALPGADDLDIYLLDSAGAVVAQSTNGGTDESIELHFPANGDYTMAVHGWAWVTAAAVGLLVAELARAGGIGRQPVGQCRARLGGLGTTGPVTADWAGFDRPAPATSVPCLTVTTLA